MSPAPYPVAAACLLTLVMGVIVPPQGDARSRGDQAGEVGQPIRNT